MKKIVIVGGGIAGLSALNRLVDLGVPATLVEAGSYPSHKVCGEFFSPECLPILKGWQIEPTAIIDHIALVAGKQHLSFTLPSQARSQSRFDFDQRLVQRAEAKGATILTHTKVQDIKQNEVVLEDGSKLPYSDLIVSSGRLFSASLPRYIGFKGHLQGVDIGATLEMYSLPGGYGGLSPIGNGSANFTCLMQKKSLAKEDFLNALFEIAPQLKLRLKGARLLFDDWMMCQVPAFGIKKTPTWANAYFIGDAAGTIPPASGMGLSLALASGYMVADYTLRGDNVGFQKAWQQRYRATFNYGRLLHQWLMRPKWVGRTIALGRWLPKLPPWLFNYYRKDIYSGPQ